MTGIGTNGKPLFIHFTIDESFPSLKELYTYFSDDGGKTGIPLDTGEFYRVRNNWIEALGTYEKYYGKDALTHLFLEKPTVKSLGLLLDAAGVALIQAGKYNIAPPAWLEDDSLHNTWRTPLLYNGVVPCLTQHYIDVLTEEKPYFFNHAMIGHAVNYDIV